MKDNSKIKNIIFDLGGVVLNIEYKRTIDAFLSLGIHDAKSFYSKASQVSLFDELERGQITAAEFYNQIREMTKSSIADADIMQAWNSLIVDLPEENVRLLKELKRKYRLFLLSNTNEIHESAYRESITNQYGSFILDELFEKMYLSHKLNLRKPEKEIFQFVLSDRKILTDETCFIDDSPQHVQAAREAGLLAIHLSGQTLVELFREKNLEVIS